MENTVYDWNYSLPSWANARESADIIYRMWRIRQPCRSAVVTYVT